MAVDHIRAESHVLNGSANSPAAGHREVSPPGREKGGLGHAALEQRYLIQQGERSVPDDHRQVLVLQGEDDHTQGRPLS